MIVKVDEIIERLDGSDWSVERESDDKTILFEAWSPAGEHLPIELEFNAKDDTFDTSVLRQWIDSYDPDENVELWISSLGKNGVPQTARELVDDADRIQVMYDDLLRLVENTDKEDEESEETSFDIFWDDLTTNCQERLKRFLGGENGNYDVIPLVSLESPGE